MFLPLVKRPDNYLHIYVKRQGIFLEVGFPVDTMLCLKRMTKYFTPKNCNINELKTSEEDETY